MKPLLPGSREERRSVSCGPTAEAPALIVFAGACLAVLFAGFLSPLAAWSGAVMLTAALAFCTVRKSVAGLYHVLFAVIVLSALVSGICVWSIGRDAAFPDSFECSAKAAAVRPWGKRTALLLETPYGRAAAYVQPKGAPEAGSEVFIRASSFPLKPAPSADAFSERVFWRSRGALRRLAVFEIKQISKPSGIASWRSRLERRFKYRLPPLTAAYMSALALGIRDEEINKLHKASGTSHLLAISGFHVGLIAAFLFYLFRKKTLGTAAVSFCIWFYVLLAGAPAGAVRAALMAQACAAALLMGRPSSAFNGVCFAGVLMLLWNPWCFYDVGWRLSVTSALFITAAAPFLNKGISGAAVVSVLVWFVTAPIAASAFREVPLLGLFANIAAVPVFTVLFPIILLFSLPALAGLPFGHLFCAVPEALLYFAHYLLNAASAALPWAIALTPALAALAAAIFFTAAVLRCRAKIETAPFICAIFLILLFYCPPML